MLPWLQPSETHFLEPLLFFLILVILYLEVIYICHLIPQETYFSLMQIKSTCDRLSQQYVLDHEDKVISLNPSCS